MRISRLKLTVELTKRDMTQAELAKQAGVSRATISYIKSGKSCSDEVGTKIARALCVPVETLI